MLKFLTHCRRNLLYALKIQQDAKDWIDCPKGTKLLSFHPGARSFAYSEACSVSVEGEIGDTSL